MDREPGDVQFDEESGEGDTLAVERDFDLARAAQARQTIEEIDAALERITKGVYGICEYSGEAIPKERLKAIPWGTRAGRVQDPQLPLTPASPMADGRGDRPAGPSRREPGALDQRSSRRPPHRWWIILVTVAIVVGVDQITKWRALESLTAGDRSTCSGPCASTWCSTPGMAFSRGSDSGPIIAWSRSSIVLVLLLHRPEGRVASCQLVLIGVVVGGALGNLVDRAVPCRDGLSDRRRRRLHRSAVLAGVQRGRRLRRGRWHPAGDHGPAEPSPTTRRARGTVIEEVIPEALAGERIDRIVALVTGCSRSEATDLDRTGRGAHRRTGRDEGLTSG